MLRAVFETVIKMNIAASLTAAAVLTVKYLLERLGFPRRVMFLLWLIIAFRLICPAAPQSRLSVMNLFTRDAAVEQTEENADKIRAAAELSETAKNPAKASALPDVIAVIWLCGATLTLICGAVSYARLKRGLRFAVKYKENVYFADNIPTAFVFGVIRPKIYVPSGADFGGLEYITEHEKAHIRRSDHISKLIAYALLSVNWFNPVNWLLFRLFSDDMEFACDESVIARLGTERKKAYMHALLNAAAGGGTVIACPVCFSESMTKRRIKAMIKIKKLSVPVIVTAVICCVAAGAVFGTNAVTAKQPQYAVKTDKAARDAEYPSLATPEAVLPKTAPEPVGNSVNSGPEPEQISAAPEPASSNPDISDGDFNADVPPERIPDGDDIPVPAEREMDQTYPDDTPDEDYAENNAADNGAAGVYTSGGVSRGDVTSIEMGTRREDVYSALGVPDNPYSSSSYDEYQLDDGGTAVLIFDDNNQLARGYIAEN